MTQEAGNLWQFGRARDEALQRTLRLDFLMFFTTLPVANIVYYQNATVGPA